MEKQYLIDFDGVILDSQDRYGLVMQGSNDLYAWMDYLSTIKWHEFLRECNQIDDSLSTLEQLQKYRKLKGIITAIHSFEEGKEKLIFLRERGIIVPVIYTLPRQKKSEVFIPRPGIVLVDDKVSNCTSWRDDNGEALQFDPKMKVEEKGKIKTLKQLL